MMFIEKKICSRCKQEKDISLFGLRNKGKYVRSWCKQCESDSTKSKYKYRPKISPIQNDSRECTICKIIKPLGDFYISKTGTGGRTSQCIECRKKISIDSNKRREYSSRYYYKNHDVLKEKNRLIMERARINLEDSYVKKLLKTNSNLKGITQDLINLNKALIKLKREIYENR